jgi:alpha-L-arabinofuranosidase
MKRALTLLLALSGLLSKQTLVGSQTPDPSTAFQSAKVEVDVSKPAGYKIPRTIFGTFLEPIGNSTYGGLWADLLENPSFEEGLWNAENLKKMLDEQPTLIRSSELGLPLPWEPLHYDQQNRYSSVWNDAANSHESLLLMGLPDAEVGVRQQIYLPIHRTRAFIGRTSLKLLAGSPKLSVSIRRRNHPEEILAETSINIEGSAWKAYEFQLDLPAGKLARLEPSDFVLSVHGETRIVLDQTNLFPADNIDSMDPDVISMAKAMNAPIIRFGGNFTSAYHWRDAVGPRDQRVSMRNVAWGIPEYNTFGTDEFLRFCQLVGAKPQVALNLGTGTPEEAADWVRYINSHWADKSGGLTWELGNELWGKFQVGYPTVSRVANLTQTFSEAIRRVDPKAVLIGTGGDEDFYHDWNAAQLQHPTAFNYLSTHFVVTTTAMQQKSPTPEFVTLANFALPLGLEARLRQMYEQIQSIPEARDKVKIAFTEWLFWAEGPNAPVRYDNMGGAVAAGGFLNMLMRNADIVPHSNMTGTFYFAGIQKERSKVFGTPAYWAFRMYSNVDATTPVQTRVTSEKYDVEGGSTRLQSIPQVPYLDVVAALDDSGTILTLFCVNRNLTRDLSTEISVAGFRNPAVLSAQSLYAPSVHSKNDSASPDAVVPTDSKVTANGQTFSITLHPASVTVISLRTFFRGR